MTANFDIIFSTISEYLPALMAMETSIRKIERWIDKQQRKDKNRYFYQVRQRNKKSKFSKPKKVWRKIEKNQIFENLEFREFIVLEPNEPHDMNQESIPIKKNLHHANSNKATTSEQDYLYLDSDSELDEFDEENHFAESNNDSLELEDVMTATNEEEYHFPELDIDGFDLSDVMLCLIDDKDRWDIIVFDQVLPNKSKKTMDVDLSNFITKKDLHLLDGYKIVTANDRPLHNYTSTAKIRFTHWDATTCYKFSKMLALKYKFQVNPPKQTTTKLGITGILTDMDPYNAIEHYETLFSKALEEGYINGYSYNLVNGECDNSSLLMLLSKVTIEFYNPKLLNQLFRKGGEYNGSSFPPLQCTNCGLKFHSKVTCPFEKGINSDKLANQFKEFPWIKALRKSVKIGHKNIHCE